MLGFETDEEITSFILGSSTNKEYHEKLRPSILEGNEIRTSEDARNYVQKLITINRNNFNLDQLICREILPHVGDNYKNKALYLGYMTKCLIDTLLGKRILTDRDHFSNKRVEHPGVLLAQIFRRLYTKTQKDL